MEPDWKQSCPSISDCLGFWKEQEVFERKPWQAEGVNRLLGALDSVLSNGGTRFGMFTFKMSPLLHWFVSRNRYHEINFFENFLSSKAFRETFPDVQPYQTPTVGLEWNWSNPYVLGGDLAYSLMFGGAYGQFKGTGKQAMELGQAFSNDLFGDRFEDIQVFRCFKPWNEWFFNIAWDGTWVGVDKRECRIWTLLQTDTD